MKFKRSLAVVMLLIFLFVSIMPVYAAGTISSSSSSRSSSSSFSGSSSSRSTTPSTSSSSKSSGFSGSSSSKSTTPSTSSSTKSTTPSTSSGFSGSSSSKTTTPSTSGSSSSSTKSTTPSTSSGSSSTKSTTPSSSSSGSGFSGSSSSTKTTSSTATKPAPTPSSAKTAALQEQYKKTVSTQNYNTYKVQQSEAQAKATEAAMSKTYSVPKKMDLNTATSTRSQRITVIDQRPVVVNYNTSRFPNGMSYGMAYVGPYDMYYTMHASDLWWYHHWAEMQLYEDYYDAVTWANRRAMYDRMAMQNMAMDANYIDPDVDPDLQFSPEYQAKHPEVFYSAPPSNGWKVFWLSILWLIIIGLIIWGIVWFINRARPDRYDGPGTY